MQQRDPNYGRRQESQGIRTGVRMSAEDEQAWSMIAHLSVLLNLITGLGGPLAALIIWLVYKDRSQRVAFHALQSLWYQIAWLVVLAVGWSITFGLMFVLIGFLLIPLMLLVSLVPFIHQCYAAYKVYQGVDYRYPIIADVIDGGRRIA